MKKLIRIIFVFIGIAVFGFLISVVVYWNFEYKPCVPKIKALVEDSYAGYENAPAELYDIAVFVEGKQGIENLVTSRLLASFGKSDHGMISWHSEGILWKFFLNQDLTKAEIFYLWCYFAPYENGHGLNNSALYRFGRNINSLDMKELFTLVAVVKAPNIYDKDPIKLNERVEKLVHKYSNSEQ